VTLWLILPVKPFREGKSRLAGWLTPDEREQINRWLLQRTLRIVSQVPEVDEVLVVSRDSHVLTVARAWGARTLYEGSKTDLNGTLNRTALLLASLRIARMLVLPVDLPRLTVEDVATLAQMLKRPLHNPVGRMVIAPDHARQGTNALGLTPPRGHTFAFGPGSFWRHVMRAREQGREVHIVERPTLAQDLDWPEDLYLLREAFPHLVQRVYEHLAEAQPKTEEAPASGG